MERQRQREYDLIAANRISKIKGGIPIHVALSNFRSITIRNKLRRLGLEGEHIRGLISLVDEIGIQNNLSNMPLGVRFSTVATKKSNPNIWKGN